MIRNLEQKDKENWTKLYNGYADFYKVPMNPGSFRHSLGDGFMMKAMMLTVFALN